jgi:hypothetical protein
MRTFLVSYDLASPNHTPALVDEIMQLGQAWARPLDNVWYLRAEETQSEIEARLSRHLSGDDGLLIQEARGNAAFLNTGLRWFRPRVRDEAPDAGAGEGTNVITFPASAQPAQPMADARDEEPLLLRAAS